MSTRSYAMPRITGYETARQILGPSRPRFANTQAAQRWLDKDLTKYYQRRKIANNTYLTSLNLTAAARIYVWLHDTTIATYYTDGWCQYQTGGWRTRVTMDRINACLPCGYRLTGSWTLRGRLPKNYRPWMIEDLVSHDEFGFDEGIRLLGTGSAT